MGELLGTDPNQSGDGVFAKHYGFSDEELDFIINYDIKYRMGASDAEDGDGASKTPQGLTPRCHTLMGKHMRIPNDGSSGSATGVGTTISIV